MPHASPNSRIAAIMVVRNEAAIVVNSVGHLLRNLKVDRVHVLDNGSIDDTPLLLDALAQIDRRVSWRRAPGRFEQAALMTQLAREAFEAGANWILPTDADEFLDPGPKGLAVLSEAEGCGALAVQLRNFVQCRWGQAFGDVMMAGCCSIESMIFSADPIGTSDTARALVESGTISFVQMAYPVKYLFRACATLAIHQGAHSADGIAGRSDVLPGGVILHAPVQAKADMARRAEHGTRLSMVSVDPETGWHVKRLARMSDAERATEWRRNSTAFGGFGLPGRRLRLDHRLRRIGQSLVAFRRDVADAVRRHAARAAVAHEVLGASWLDSPVIGLLGDASMLDGRPDFSRRSCAADTNEVGLDGDGHAFGPMPA